MTDPGWNLEKLVTVGTFAAPWEARLAQARLATEGIDAVVADENVGSLYGGSLIGGIKLRVREEDTAHAAEVLAREKPLSQLYLVTEDDARELQDAAAEIDPSEPDLVTVARFETPWEVHLARTFLESHGIDACVMEERFPPLALLTGQPLALNRLAVHPDDADRALEILAEAETSGAEGLSAGES
ncbi:MAG TPA: DUF2007 domain-containing protein [Thermoanaerobaculia bacterium]|nr:DUF2007 domain-containing protein [Thermoanaerobaculia bacterium]